MAGGGLTEGVAHLVAPAKLTLSLLVVGVRSDGYHELTAEMVSLDLADELVIDPSAQGIRVMADRSVRIEGLSTGPDNLVSRALGALGRSAGVELTKRIPVRGGLGGGSSDAGAVLRWAGSDDLALAATLGADVPFCVRGGRAMVSGIGEVVANLPFEERSFVLLIPPFGIDTGSVFRAWDRLSHQLGRPWHEAPNDLTRAAVTVEPQLAVWRRALSEATGREPVLAGSGSTWFVEGQPATYGLEHGGTIPHGGEIATVLGVRTVPEGWGPEGWGPEGWGTRPRASGGTTGPMTGD